MSGSGSISGESGDDIMYRFDGSDTLMGGPGVQRVKEQHRQYRIALDLAHCASFAFFSLSLSSPLACSWRNRMPPEAAGEGVKSMAVMMPTLATLEKATLAAPPPALLWSSTIVTRSTRGGEGENKYIFIKKGKQALSHISIVQIRFVASAGKTPLSAAPKP